jgi:hypothetical protein
VGPGRGEQLGLGALGDDPPFPDHDEVVGDDLDLVQEVRRQQHGGAPVGVAAQQVTHAADSGGSSPFAGGQTHGPLRQREDLASRAAAVLGGGVEQDPDLQA